MLEKKLFKCLVMSNINYQRILQLSDNIFIDLKKYFDILKDIRVNREYVTFDVLENEYEKRNVEIDTLRSIEDISIDYHNFDYYLQEYLEYYKNRNIDNYLLEYREQKINFDVLKSNIDNLYQMKPSIDTDTANMYEIICDSLDDKPQTFIDTQFNFFKDEGGFRDGEYIIIGARPSVGKTTYMNNIIAFNLYNNIKTGVFTSEVSKKRLNNNIICMIAEVDTIKFNAGLMTKDEEMKIAKVKDYFKDKFKDIIINDKPSIDIDLLYLKAKEMKNKHDVKCICIDYLQLLTAGKYEMKDARIQYNYISRRLKQLSRELNIPVIVLAQLNREADDKKRPTKRDLKETGNIEQDADIIILLTEKLNEIGERNNLYPIIENIVDKNRNGRTGLFLTKINRSIGFVEVLKNN